MTATDAQSVPVLEKRRFESIAEQGIDGFADLAHPALAYTRPGGTLDTPDSFAEK